MKNPTGHDKPGTAETELLEKLKLAPRLSIVVLPLSNLSNDAGKDYFADGITDSLITGLSRSLPGSFVVARATAFTYKGKAIDARQIDDIMNGREPGPPADWERKDNPSPTPPPPPKGDAGSTLGKPATQS